MKYTRQLNHMVPVLGLLAALLFIVAPQAEARTYSTSVTITKYYGQRGYDCHGNPLYGVKVQQGYDNYYVELLNPMPCLTQHQFQKKHVVITRSGTQWMTAKFEGHTARIHRVAKLQHAESPYYHDTAASHSHNHSEKVKVKSPFFGWFDW